MVTFLAEQLEENAENVTLIENEREITAYQFIHDIKRACGFWKSFVEGKGHHIGLIGENSYFWLVQFLGIIASGNVAVAFNYNLSDEDLQYQAEISDTEIVLCDNDQIKEYQIVFPESNVLEFSSAFGEKADIMKSPTDKMVTILFSSGTSGKSKPVPLTSGNFMAYAKQCLKEPSGKVTLMPLPFYHISGLYCYYELVKGNKLMISNGKYLIRDIRQENMSRIFLVPAMIKQIFQKLSRGEIEKKQLDGINMVSLGATLPPEEEEQLAKSGVRMEVFYGMTETTGLISGPIGKYRSGACGKVMPYVNLKIIDGEIVVKGNNVMNGYYKMDRETWRIKKDGWLYTGDLGRMDEDGYLYITGRKKNIIILSNGENVSPEEVESRLYQHRWITECKVYGESGAIYADIFTQKEENIEFEERKQEILAFIKKFNQKVPLTHRIREIHVMEQELPKTATGKIKR